MIQESKKHLALLLFDLLLTEIRIIVREEMATLPEQINKMARSKETVVNRRRFYNIAEAAVELNLSRASVRRLITRGLLRPSRATRHIQIPSEQIDGFERMTM